MNDYMNYEQSFIGQLSTRKIKNAQFYDQLNENFAKIAGYEKIPIHKTIIDNKSKSMIHDPCDTKKLSLNMIEHLEPDGEAMTDPHDRQKYLMKNTDLTGLNESQLEKMAKIFLEYSEAFFIPNDIFKPTTIYKHTIKLKPNGDTFIGDTCICETISRSICKERGTATSS